MAIFTTNVRTICESLANNRPSDAISADWFIDNAIPQIFNGDFTTYDPLYKNVLLHKILKHYYMREIGQETYGQWKMRINTRLEEIMPYYNMFYKAALLEYNPLYTIDVHTVRDIVGNEQKQENENRLGKIDTEGQGNTTRNTKDRFSDTPQGTLQNIENNTYLTTADITDSTDDVTNEQHTTDDTKRDLTHNIDNTEKYLEHVFGTRPLMSMSRLIMEFRDSIVNVDMLIIKDLADLFMGVWA